MIVVPAVEPPHGPRPPSCAAAPILDLALCLILSAAVAGLLLFVL